MKVFIGGCPRSGTSWTFGIVSQAIPPFDPNGRIEAKRDTESNVFKHTNVPGTFVTKLPRYPLLYDKIVNRFPDAKLIRVTRNPYATINSLLKTTFVDGNKTFKRVGNIDEAIQLYNKHQVELPDTTFTLHYETLVEQLPDLSDYLGVELSDIPKLPQLKNSNDFRKAEPDSWKKELTPKQISYIEARI